jgi:hypothetical protein
VNSEAETREQAEDDAVRACETTRCTKPAEPGSDYCRECLSAMSEDFWDGVKQDRRARN